jgi:hypothetical protein
LYKYNILFNIAFSCLLLVQKTEIPDKDPPVEEDDLTTDDLSDKDHPVKEGDPKTKKTAGKKHSPPVDPAVPLEFRDVFSNIVK